MKTSRGVEGFRDVFLIKRLEEQRGGLLSGRKPGSAKARSIRLTGEEEYNSQ